MGRLVSGLLVAYLNIQGAWIVTGVLAAAGLYFASSISFWAVKETVADRWMWLQSWYDRWRDWREDSRLPADRRGTWKQRRTARAGAESVRGGDRGGSTGAGGPAAAEPAGGSSSDASRERLSRTRSMSRRCSAWRPREPARNRFRLRGERVSGRGRNRGQGSGNRDQGSGIRGQGTGLRNRDRPCRRFRCGRPRRGPHRRRRSRRLARLRRNPERRALHLRSRSRELYRRHEDRCWGPRNCATHFVCRGKTG